MMDTGTMTAWQVVAPGPVSSHPLQRVTVSTPQPGPDELLVKVLACGCVVPICMWPKGIWQCTGHG